MPYLTPDEWIFVLLLVFIVYGVGLIPRLAAAFIRQLDEVEEAGGRGGDSP